MSSFPKNPKRCQRVVFQESFSRYHRLLGINRATELKWNQLIRLFFEYQRKASGLIEKPSLERRKEALMSQR